VPLKLFIVFKLQRALFSAELRSLLRMYSLHMCLNSCFTVVYLITKSSRLFWCTFHIRGMTLCYVVKYLPLRGPVVCADFSKPISFATFVELGMLLFCIFNIKILKWWLYFSRLANLITFNMMAGTTWVLKNLSTEFTRIS